MGDGRKVDCKQAKMDQADWRWTGNGSQMDRNESNRLEMGQKWTGNALDFKPDHAGGFF